MPRMTLEVKKDSPDHDFLRRKLDSILSLAKRGHQKQYSRWNEAEDRTLAFLPETEEDSMRRSRRTDGRPTYTTIQIPYTYALLMSAHTYWTSVFFARSPVHQFTGRHGEGEQQIQAVEALIGYQVEVGGFVGPYYVWIYDIGKYGCGILGEYWDKQVLEYGQLVEMPDPVSQKPGLYYVTQQTQGYQGNRVYNVSPWDFMADPRRAFKDFQKGEFCCVRKRMGWNDILRRKEQGFFNDNIEFLRHHTGDIGRGEPSSALERPQFDMFMDSGVDNVKVRAGNVFWEVYVELVPKDWKLGPSTYPQKWCFTITEDRTLIVGATPLGFMHCQFPFAVGESEVEGYGLYTRGIPEIIQPIQNTMDWLINTHFFNVRASLNNQFIVDPSKIVVKDIKNSGPGFIWRLRPEAFGTDLRTIFMQVPVNDVTRAHMADFQSMLGVGERALGINDQIMGSLNVGGTRKTATEVRTSTGFGVNRLKTVSEYMSATAFSPHAQRMVQNSQQLYDVMAKLRRVGSFAQEAGQQFLNVSPDDIVGFYDFVPVDGVLPIDRMAQANLWKEIMGSIRNMPPQVAMGYDWGRIFAWMAQIGGLKNINQFKIQVVPDQQLAGQVQAGNVIPMPKRPGLPAPASGAEITPGNASSTQTGLNALGPQSGGGY